MYVEEDYNGRANYVKIAPKMTPMLKAHQGNYLFNIYVNYINLYIILFEYVHWFDYNFSCTLVY
jgi:hypothetical protein